MYKAENIVDHFIGLSTGNKDELAQRISNLKDLYGRTNRFANLKIVDISSNKPKSMDKFLKRYPEFFYEK